MAQLINIKKTCAINRIKIILNAFALTLLCLGCSQNNSMPSGPTSSSESEEPNDTRKKRFVNFSKEFADHLMFEDYQSAYKLTSSHLQKQMDFDAFKKAHEEAIKKFGKPLKYEIDLYSIDPKEFDSLFDDIPEYIPKNLLQARTAISLGIELDDKGEIDRCYDCMLTIVNENGQDKVALFGYDWCD